MLHNCHGASAKAAAKDYVISSISYLTNCAPFIAKGGALSGSASQDRRRAQEPSPLSASSNFDRSLARFADWQGGAGSRHFGQSLPSWRSPRHASRLAFEDKARKFTRPNDSNNSAALLRTFLQPNASNPGDGEPRKAQALGRFRRALRFGPRRRPSLRNRHESFASLKLMMSRRWQKSLKSLRAPNHYCAGLLVSERQSPFRFAVSPSALFRPSKTGQPHPLCGTPPRRSPHK